MKTCILFICVSISLPSFANSIWSCTARCGNLGRITIESKYREIAWYNLNQQCRSTNYGDIIGGLDKSFSEEKNCLRVGEHPARPIVYSSAYQHIDPTNFCSDAQLFLSVRKELGLDEMSDQLFFVVKNLSEPENLQLKDAVSKEAQTISPFWDNLDLNRSSNESVFKDVGINFMKRNDFNINGTLYSANFKKSDDFSRYEISRDKYKQFIVFNQPEIMIGRRYFDLSNLDPYRYQGVKDLVVYGGIRPGEIVGETYVEFTEELDGVIYSNKLKLSEFATRFLPTYCVKSEKEIEQRAEATIRNALRNPDTCEIEDDEHLLNLDGQCLVNDNEIDNSIESDPYETYFPPVCNQ